MVSFWAHRVRERTYAAAAREVHRISCIKNMTVYICTMFTARRISAGRFDASKKCTRMKCFAASLPEDKIKIITDVAQELVFKHGVPQSELYAEITRRLEEQCTEKEYVLYNTCYGGFSFTAAFRKFAQLEHNIEYERTGMYEPIKEFGKHMVQKHPLLLDMVSAYYVHDYTSEFTLCHQYKTTLESRDMLAENLNTLYRLKQEYGGNAYMVDKFNRPPVSNLSLMQYNPLNTDNYCFDTSRLHKNDDAYTLDDVIRYLEDQLKIYQEKVEKAAVGLDQACLQTIMYKFPEEVANDALPRYQRKKWTDDMYFLKALNNYGVEHFVTWKCQKLLDETHMRHILIHNLHRTTPASNSAMERCYTTIGLLCASGKYASLDFAEVPKGMSWSIGEYDGYECVTVD